MPISLSWADENASVMYCEFVNGWKWEDFQSAIANGYALIREAPHIVTIIIDAERSHGLPKGSPFGYLGKAIQRTPPNTGLIILITRNRFAKMSMSIASKMYSLQDRFVIVSSTAEAHTILMAQREQYVLRQRLIAALHTGQPEIIEDAIETLRVREWLYDGTLQGLPLRGAKLNGANLFMANLANADLEMAELRDANLFMVNLRESRLLGVDFSGATLAEADLSASDLRFADLRRANLHGAKLVGANLERTRFDHDTVLPDGTNWHLGCDLRVFVEVERKDSWYAALKTEDETLPSRPPGWDQLLSKQ